MSKNLLINTNDMSIFEPRRYYQEYEGTFITATDKSEDDTLDTSRYIEVTEIWGNTWQDSDGKNLFDEKSLSSTTYPERRTISYIGNKIVVNNLIEYSYTRESHDMSINLKAGTYTLSLSNVENTNNNFCAVMLGLDNEIIVTVSANDKIKYKTFTVSSDCNVTVETNVLGTYIGEIKFNVQLEEGAKATEYEPYYKADLSDIQSIGELYVNEDGEPILDDLGREQYKVEIESCNKNLFNTEKILLYDNINGNRFDVIDNNAIKITKGNTYCRLKAEIKGKPNTTYILTYTQNDSSSGYFAGIGLGGATSNIGVTTGNNGIFNLWFSSSNFNYRGEVIFNKIIIKEQGSSSVFIPSEHNKTTILLPCQLQKVGDVYDRLYWDSEKGKYVVEKNVGVDSLNRLGISIIATHSSEHTRTFFRVPVDIKKGTRQSIVKGILNKDDRTKDMFAVQYDTETMLFIRKSLIKPLDPENITDDDIKSYVQKLLSENEYTLYYQRETPQLIETNITEKILLPCYEEKTHIFVNSTVDATMKVLVPYKEIL